MLTVIAITIVLLILYAYLGWKRPGIALLTVPFVTGVFIVIGVAEENIAAVCIAPLIFVATLIAALLSKREPDEEQWPRMLVKCVFISIGWVFLLAAMLILVGSGGYGALLFALFLAAIARFGLISWEATALHVISTIGSSMRQNLPLPMALESAASGLSDKRSRVLNSIRKWLVQGYSLSESIKRGYPRCPGYAVAMIAAAERIDQLPRAIAALEADMVVKAAERRKIRPVHPIYPVVLITFTLCILLGLTTFVVPQYETALQEVVEGAALPAATRFLIGITHFMTYQYGWLIGVALALIVLVVVPLSIYVRFRPRRADKPYLSSRIGDFLKWHLPILHRFERDYSMVQVVELLRLSLNAGCTVNDAISNTLGLDVNNCFKKRLRKWLRNVERGDNISAAGRASGLGSALAWAFDDKVNQGSTLSILETLESFYRSNYSYCVNLARFILWPCVILVMGATVGFIVFAIFSPLIAVITQLAGQVNP